MPFFRSPAEDLRIFRRAFSQSDRRSYAKRLGLWFAAGGVVLVLAILDSGGTLSQVLFRIWLLGGAGYALAQTAKLAPLKPDENISTFAALVFIAMVLLVGLIVGGSILTLFEED